MSERWFLTYRRLRDTLVNLAAHWERDPSIPPEVAQTLYALPQRLEALPHNATEADLWAVVHQAIEDGKEDAERWAEEGGNGETVIDR